MSARRRSVVALVSRPAPGLAAVILHVACSALAAAAPVAGGTSGEESETPAAGSNLTLSGDIPDATRRAVQEAIDDFVSVRDDEESTDRDLRSAIGRLETAAGKVLDSPVPQYYLGIGYQLRRKFDRARKHIDKALELNPRFHEAWVELGDIHVWEKSYQKAVETYDRALEITPGYALALERKASVLLRMGKFREAKDVIEDVQKIEPSKGREQLAKLIDIELRGPGWETTYTSESENYIISTPISQSYAEEINEAAERILRVYKEIFPDIKRPARKYNIWVHADKQAYVRAGNPMQAGGHYEPLVRKLVLFRHDNNKDTILVLNHEAFHQFLHDYSEAAPQWFNEGLGDYYGAFQYEKRGSGGFMRSYPNPWRLKLIQQAIRYNKCPPVADLMLMTRKEMYNPRMAGVHYAQAWSLIYFVLEIGKRYGYDRLLVNYFRALKRGYDQERAFQVTFGRINMDRFEKQWKDFITRVEYRR